MSNMTSADKRIVKNTFFLYIRMLLKMGVSLFSSRIILQVLGVQDYGLYTAIGSIVAMFSIIKGTLDAGTSRFLTYELGKGDEKTLGKIFNAALVLHFLMAIIIFIFCETIGLWFLNEKMNIPANRYAAAKYLLLFSAIGCSFNIIQVPYSASVIAHEKMSLYAWIGLGEVFWNVGVLLFLSKTNVDDKLIFYGLLVAIYYILLQLFYFFYCKKNFKETKFVFVAEKNLYRKLLSFSVWDLIGNFCATGNSHGLNILVNIFFGVAINAARGVAYQLEHAIQLFMNNFMIAVTPQITKRYADNNIKDMLSLVNTSSKFSFLLLYMLSLPVFLEVDYLLTIWLVEVPEMTVTFVRLLLPIMVFRAFSRPIILSVHATGNIKFLNLSGGLFSLVITLPITYVLFKMGFSAKVMFYVSYIKYPVCSMLELIALKREIKFSIKHYFINVIVNGFIIAALSSIIPIAISILLEESFIRLLLVSLASLLSILLFAFLLGIKKDERKLVIEMIEKKIFPNKCI